MLDFDKKILNDIEKLKSDIEALSRANQSRILKYGKITLDGENGAVLVNSNTDLEIIRFDTSGMTLTQAATSNNYADYVNFKRGTDLVGRISHIRYTPSDVVTDIRLRTLSSNDNDRNAFVSLEVDDYLGNRDIFFQMSDQYIGGVFESASLVFRKEFVSGKNTLEVRVTNENGDGFMRIPEQATDVAYTIGASIYWSRSAGKFRGVTPAGFIVDLN